MPEKPTFENEPYYYEGVMTIAENMVPRPDPQICAVPEPEPEPEPEPDPEPPASGDGGK